MAPNKKNWMRNFCGFILTLIFLAACTDKSSPEYRLRQYLTALKEKNFDEAKRYCENTAVYNLECALKMGTTDFGITDIRDIRCKINKRDADCTFCCMKDNPDQHFRLVKEKDEWLIVGVKETCPLDDIPNSDPDTLENDPIH